MPPPIFGHAVGEAFLPAGQAPKRPDRSVPGETCQAAWPHISPFCIFFRSRQTRTARNSPQLPSRSKGSRVEHPTDPRVPRQQDTKACRCPDGELQSVSRRGTTFRVEPERQCSPGKTLALHAVVRRVHSTSCGEEPHSEEQITP